LGKFHHDLLAKPDEKYTNIEEKLILQKCAMTEKLVIDYVKPFYEHF